MSHAGLTALVTVIAIGSLALVPASGQSQAQRAADTAPPWTLPRTPDGRPDLQGYWTTQTFTPLERPEYLAGKEFFTEEETAALQQQFTAEGVDPVARDAINLEDAEAREKRLYQTNRDATYVHYDNEIWLRTVVPKGLSSRRTSLITDPPDGRIPPLTPKAAARVAAAAEARQHPSAFDSYETRPLSERCIAWQHEGPPILPPFYNDIHQIFQTPDHVVVFTELGQQTRRASSRSTGGRISQTRFASSPVTRVAGGKGIRWSSTPPTSSRGGASEDPPGSGTSWNASPALTPTQSATSSRSTIRPPGRARGARRFRW